MNRILQNERGMALGVAIFAMVVVGALVAGIFFVGTQEQRVGENVRRSSQAFGVAEGGAYEIVKGWNPTAINMKRVFPLDSVHFASTLATGRSGYYGGDVFKLNKNMYLVDVTGMDRVGAATGARKAGARNRVGMLVRIKPVDFGIRAAVTTRGVTNVKGNAIVDGLTHVPPGWTTCDPAPDTAKAGVRHPNLSQITASGGGDAYGSPPMLQDPTVGDPTFNQFGDVSYADLVARATLHLPGGTYAVAPSVIGAVCNTANVLNWGDGANHAAPCASYYPIVHITGNVQVNGVQGQGILLVDGDFTMAGGFTWYGIVVVKGALKAAGNSTVYGAVLASNVNVDVISIVGTVRINYSKCAIVSALQNTGTVSTIRSRSFVQMF